MKDFDVYYEIEERWIELIPEPGYEDEFDVEDFRALIKETDAVLKEFAGETSVHKDVLRILLQMQKFAVGYSDYECELSAAKLITAAYVSDFSQPQKWTGKVQLCLDYYDDDDELILENPFPYFDLNTADMDEIIDAVQMLFDNGIIL